MHNQLDAARHRSGLSHQDLWVRYFALGGSASQEETQDFLESGGIIDVQEQDVLAYALVERFREVGQENVDLTSHD